MINLREIMFQNINLININVVLISLFLICFTQSSFAKESIEETPKKDSPSKCTTIKMKGNVVIGADSATVYTDEQNRTVIILPKSNKKHFVLLKSDYQECISTPISKDHK
ncbi:hypothetical protein [Francisella adeliensis]|uniref:Uncharacterized protein n=2 Tax=Francisella adeliensis TaxID=2007306 RepID=A0ABX6KGZ6_9GAMM|nr:hypothetical protein [Francisella adeliensis]MBK2086332.1 hypothetical protein [Francisella adeliensis]MBK2096547.1 hypothetical protein [Francisella adeliensis]QIW12851.1 hypothetical protein FZC43_09465 [Francisella adeliensis]QIW14728.1 hypothetical protein FZC44_09455 [Francisella adeliensis]